MQQLVNKDNLLTNYVQEQLAKNSANRKLSIIDSLQMDTNLREILKTQYYYEMLQNRHNELPHTLIEQYKKEVSNPSLQVYILSQQQKYEKLSNKTIEHPESLMPNEPLAEITDGEQLFRKIIEPYKGKVIYLDVWGTWCGPCKNMMQYAKASKKLFAGKRRHILVSYAIILRINHGKTSSKNMVWAKCGPLQFARPTTRCH